MLDARPQTKRRRLNPPSNTSILLTESIPPKPAPKTSAVAVCASCHRASTASATPILVCPRCSAPTCTVCSRTCTSRTPFSMPNTSAHSWPPAPRRRTALALNAPNTNTSAPVKRKKPRDDDERDSDQEEQARDGCVLGTGTGCGRTLCRECCFESPQESATTCYDCRGL
ncbi:hypothetical protein DFH06DRAFT_1201058 [Mycena polygramma]|nr:hypothetical protein DFH06DRAFT_1258855 [Mycena polygramma]KAJ7603404.1 hypothetical protein DFH06DRAFT_1256744 [Mycena polygramma]KAJ7655862.1 hypothetical protein DFH06DRAFT_1201058 [Mycena polygramma]